MAQLEPLGLAELRGHVVLVDFWTLTCINWLRQEPHVRAWSRAYRDDGLIVIGVHTPEFSFEHEIDNMRQAIKERGIDYPVAVDNGYEVGTAFDNHYWPALYFIDADGVIREHHFGEGRDEQSEGVIQRLLGVERELVSPQGVGMEAEAGWDHLDAPETYLGYGRSEQFASSGRRRCSTNAATTSYASALGSTTGRSPASGRSGARCRARASRREHRPRFDARGAHFVVSPGTRDTGALAGPTPTLTWSRPDTKDQWSFGVERHILVATSRKGLDVKAGTGSSLSSSTCSCM